MNNILSILGAMAVVGCGVPSVMTNSAHYIDKNISILHTNYPTTDQDFHSTAEVQLDPAISAGEIDPRTINTWVSTPGNPSRLINKVHIKGYFAIIDWTNKKEYREITILKYLNKSTAKKLIFTYYDEIQYGSDSDPNGYRLGQIKVNVTIVLIEPADNDYKVTIEHEAIGTVRGNTHPLRITNYISNVIFQDYSE
ncbi:hypothetical protein [Spiroplasma endosymbiont of Glossina fuscipes fuscipes]|uniref:hypothetical protein n=1 Tax=Spiroplasma endosymbiont of Glossina fuscipes fuscipes TaxID=2004463 RepID=UPI003CEFD3C0